MSYADAAKKGPKQSDSEVPDAVPEIAHSDSSVHSLDSSSTGGDHINTISYADLQRDADQRDAELSKRNAEPTADQAMREAKDFMKRAEESGNRLEAKGAKKYQQSSKDSKDEWDELSKKAKNKYNEFSNEAEAQANKAEAKAKKGEEWAEKNKGNPVVIGNVVVVGALAALLGTTAYRMHKAGTWTWQVAGTWAGVVGLFAVGDYYVSHWFFKNKYPPK